MSDISELEQRLAVALRRISIATEALPKVAIMDDTSSNLDSAQASGQSSDALALSQIRSSLAVATAKITAQDEKIVTLVYALGVARENQTPSMPAEDNQSSLLVDAVLALEVELSQLKQSNTQLRQANQSLRDANAKGLGDAGLINSGLKSELDSLNAERKADMAQLNVLFTALNDAASIDVLEKKSNA